MSILLSSYRLEFLASNKWKCNILIWNQLFLKEEGPFFTFPTKSHFWHFWLFFLFWPISPFLWSTTWYLFLYGRTHINSNYTFTNPNMLWALKLRTHCRTISFANQNVWTCVHSFTPTYFEQLSTAVYV